MPADMMSKDNRGLSIRIVSKHFLWDMHSNIKNSNFRQRTDHTINRGGKTPEPMGQDHYEPSERTDLFKSTNYSSADNWVSRDRYIQGEAKSSKAREGREISVTNLNPKMVWIKEKHRRHFDTVIIHFHGGAFITLSSAKVMNYVFPWVKSLDVTVFSVDYRLAPQAKYPQIPNDAINAYLWIIFFLTGVLGNFF